MFGLFKRKTNEFTITVTRTGSESVDAVIREKEFLNKAHVCPECNHSNSPSGIVFEGNGKRYKVPVKCSKCKCEWTYERPYTF